MTRKRSLRLYIHLFILLLFCSATAHSENTSPAKTSETKIDTTKTASDPLIVTANSDPMNRVGHPLFVVINLKNVSNEDISFDNLTTTIDLASAEKFKNIRACIPQQTGDITIRNGRSIELSCRFEMKDNNISWNLSSWQNTLLSADIRFAVTVNTKTQEDLNYYPSINIKAPESSIFVGGLIGALLLAIFVWVETMIKQPLTRQEWIKSFLFTVLLGLRGGIMAMIALIIGKTTQSTGSPISLTVTDFSGGIVIGLFSYPLASWISSTLKLDGVFVSKKNENQPDKEKIANDHPAETVITEEAKKYPEQKTVAEPA
ncbi:hypothetical protein ACO0LC_11170 [Undibacterium sp. JH2W]|uniref:hypothetical protein n=1 Tax=Undibacterium sp. JH2W TaxID=3413037 RepID=UPI003BF223F8